MFYGVFYALSACLIWGLIFVIPQMLSEFTPIEIALGRYFFFGAFSFFLLLRNSVRNKFFSRNVNPKIWMQAFKWGLLAGLFYYVAVVIAMRYISPAITTLILGLAPLTIAFLGQWSSKKTDWGPLWVPSLLIFAGLLFINLPMMNTSSDEFSWQNYSIGFLAALISLASWTFYVVSNARFLSEHPEVSSSEWSTLIGVANLAWVCVGGILLMFINPDWVRFFSYAFETSVLFKFTAGSFVLGVVCAWMGAVLWNRAARLLPVTITGQLMIFETVFGLIFVYFYEQRMPFWFETLGMAAMLSGVYVSLNAFNKKSYHPVYAQGST